VTKRSNGFVGDVALACVVLVGSSFAVEGCDRRASSAGHSTSARQSTTEHADTFFESAPRVVRQNPSPSAGCGRPANTAAPLRVYLDVGEVKRSYFLVHPSAYDPNRPYPVVLGFHGSGSNGAEFRDALDLERLDRNAAMFAYPDGLDVAGTTAWLLGPDERDVAFVDAVLAEIEANYCVDRRSIFAVGFSYGGWMVNALACARPSTIRGIVSISGGGPMGNCTGGVAAMMVHGSGDFDEPIMSGEASRDHWIEANGCGRPASPQPAGPCVSYPGCAGAKPVWWCRHDRGHEIPAYASERTWAFLKTQF
jgi:polyhydroxybutyrate depolymerase